MVKFSRELEAQLIPEWKDAFVNYRQLKKHIKKIKLAFLRQSPPSSSDSTIATDRNRFGFGFGFGVSLLDPLRYATSRLSTAARRDPPATQVDEENFYEMELVQSREDEVNEFLEKLESELDKVNNFYKSKENEFLERGEILTKQLHILTDLKQILHDHHHRRRRHSQGHRTPASPDTLISSPPSSHGSANDSEMEGGSPMAEAVIAALERNGVTFVGSGRTKVKKGGKPKAAALRIDIPATTPGRTISAVTSIIWEDLVNSSRKDGNGGGSGDYISRKKMECAEKMIRGGFVELYRGLGLLRTYSSLNMVAFRKILKKFDKVSNQQSSSSYLKKVKRSHFISSDKVVRLADDVESIFMKQFASNDRKKAMKFLRPQQPTDSHMITFFVGLFTGSFVTLFSVYAILAHISGIFSTTTEIGYMETVYPVFSMFALLSLHIFLYGVNIFMWKRTRINHNFIFEFSPTTALKHRDAFLICTSIMTVVIGAMVIHLILRSADIFPNHVDAIPRILLMLVIGILFCPMNVFYRSTRLCFLRVIRNIIFSPFYKVLMVDFVMADQLTSQIPLLRHIEFTTCYFMAGIFKMQPYETCTRSQQYKLLAYIISFLPYHCRAMQCVRRYIEEGYDVNHLANMGKYVSAMLAAAARMKYAVNPTPLWLATVIISSTLATLYQLYWDYVKDWGLLDPSSRNPWLRDELILKRKSTYYASMTLNFVLRMAWVSSVLHFRMGSNEHRLIDFTLASLEIIRRGHWNFYRLENEHLNNVGKFRAVKAVPLPFREMESDE